MLYDFPSGMNIAANHHRLCNALNGSIVSRLEIVNERTFSLINKDCLWNLVESNHRSTIRELVTETCCDQPTIVHHLAAVGKVRKLTATDRELGIDACDLSQVSARSSRVVGLDYHWDGEDDPLCQRGLEASVV